MIHEIYKDSNITWCPPSDNFEEGPFLMLVTWDIVYLSLSSPPDRMDSHCMLGGCAKCALVWEICACSQVKKTTEATLQTIQDMVTIEDYDVSECFQHSRSTESVKSTVSETYLSKPSIAKRRANQQETEQFYFMVRLSPPQPPLALTSGVPRRCFWSPVAITWGSSLEWTPAFPRSFWCSRPGMGFKS